MSSGKKVLMAARTVSHVTDVTVLKREMTSYRGRNSQTEEKENPLWMKTASNKSYGWRNKEIHIL